MPQQNLVSVSFTDEETASLETALNTLNSVLLPKLKTMSADAKKELPKMGDKTLAFVQKAVEYCKANPDLVPPFVDVDEFDSDMNGSVR